MTSRHAIAFAIGVIAWGVIIGVSLREIQKDGELQRRAAVHPAVVKPQDSREAGASGNPSSSALADRHGPLNGKPTDSPQREPVTADTEGQPRSDEASRPLTKTPEGAGGEKWKPKRSNTIAPALDRTAFVSPRSPAAVMYASPVTQVTTPSAATTSGGEKCCKNTSRLPTTNAANAVADSAGRDSTKKRASRKPAEPKIRTTSPTSTKTKTSTTEGGGDARPVLPPVAPLAGVSRNRGSGKPAALSGSALSGRSSKTEAVSYAKGALRRPHIVPHPGADYCAEFAEPGRTDYKVEAHRYASCDDGRWKNDAEWIRAGKRPCYVPEWRFVEGRCDLVDDFHHQTQPIEFDFAAFLSKQVDENGKRLYDVPSIDCVEWVRATPPKITGPLAYKTVLYPNAIVVTVQPAPTDSRTYKDQIIGVEPDCINCKIPVRVPCRAGNVSNLHITWMLTWPVVVPPSPVPVPTPVPDPVPAPADIYYVARAGSPPGDGALKAQGFKPGDNVWFLRDSSGALTMWQVQPPSTGAYPGAVFGRTIK